MAYDAGFYKDLYIVRERPSANAPSLLSWESVAGRQVSRIVRHDESDHTYEVCVPGIEDSFWVPESWVERIEGAEKLRRAWQHDQIAESQRQMKYAAAFQRLMWRELMGRAVKKRVGDRVIIKGQARAIERCFPGAWHSEWYALSWGREGVVQQETRSFGQDGELYRGYRVRIEIPGHPEIQHTFLWWLGEDLEG